MEFLNEIKIIWSHLRQYKKEIFKIYVFALISSAVLALIPYLYGRLVDIVQIQPLNLVFIFSILGIWLITGILGAIFQKQVSQKGGFLGVDISTDLICRVSTHLIRLPISFHKQKKIGEVYARIERAASDFLRIIETILFWTIPHFLTAIIGILILFLIEWKLGLGVFIVSIGYILITFYKTPAVIKSHEKLNQITEEVSGNLYDSVLNVSTIKSCAIEKFQEEKTRKDYKEKVSPVHKDSIGRWADLELWQEIFFVIGFVGLFGAAISFLVAKVISTGELIMFFGYLNLVRVPLINLSWQWQMFRRGMTTIKRVEMLLNISQEDYGKEGKILENMKGKVEFKNVGFGYRKKKLILEDINFIVQPGQKIALVGGSGEGKTTLVDLISLYFKQFRGKIFVDDIEIRDLNLKFLRENIAYVPQDIILFNDTVKNNILLGNPQASEEEIVKAAKAANAHQFIKTFPKKYDQIVGERGIKLSAGQKQRIAIARVLIRNAKILVLDEATSSLDSESEKFIQLALEELVKGRTTFIIAHRLSTVRKADQILILEKGKIVERGTHRELIAKKGVYFKFYSLQF